VANRKSGEIREIRDSQPNHHFGRAFGNCVWVCCLAFPHLPASI
jgi:hypothetical protein